MQQFVGEEKNDLLDYLRSLKPEQVFPFSGISEFPCIWSHSPLVSFAMLHLWHILLIMNKIFSNIIIFIFNQVIFLAYFKMLSMI